MSRIVQKTRVCISVYLEIKCLIFVCQGSQMTDVELDERVTALEENGGGGNTANGK